MQWRGEGSPRQGPMFELMKRSRASFKYAVRQLKRDEERIRADNMARKMADKNYTDFWKEIKMVNNSRVPLPSSIEGVSGRQNITLLWKEHFENLLNSVGRNRHEGMENRVMSESYDKVVVKREEVADAIRTLESGKSCGMDGVTAEHPKLCSGVVVEMLSVCFTCMFTHGYLPKDMLSIVLIPILKDKAGNLSSKDNYRPVALASITSKVLEVVILRRIEGLLETCGNQFGFKRKHGTDMCIYVLKELVHRYKSLGSKMYLCFLDASKAFDRVNHSSLFVKLRNRGVPEYIVRLLAFWYKQQNMFIRWGNVISESFRVSNGVRQGSILSPYLFNIYMNDLSKILNTCKVDCLAGSQRVNHLMYAADDLVLLSPSSKGLSELLHWCQCYGIQADIKYNGKKSVVMICNPTKDKPGHEPNFVLNNDVLPVKSKVKYLGHIISDTLADDEDMARQRRSLYVQGNVISRRFAMCSPTVKTMLFRTYCTSMCTAHIWCSYKKATIAFRMILGAPRYCSASEMFAHTYTPSCPTVRRKMIYSFRDRLEGSKNCILVSILGSDIRCCSPLWRNWDVSLYTRFM